MAFDIEKTSKIIDTIIRLQKVGKLSLKEGTHLLSELVNAWNGTHHKNALSFFNPYESATEFGIANVVNPVLLTTTVALGSALTSIGLAGFSALLLGVSICDFAHGSFAESGKDLLLSIAAALTSIAIAILVTPAIVIGFAVNLMTRTFCTVQEVVVNFYDELTNIQIEDMPTLSPR